RHFPYANMESSHGSATGLSSLRARTLGWPITLMLARGPDSKRPSIAASATGWCSATSLAWRSPVGKATNSAASAPAVAPTLKLSEASASWRAESFHQAPTAQTTKLAVVRHPIATCANSASAQGLDKTSE